MTWPGAGVPHALASVPCVTLGDTWVSLSTHSDIHFPFTFLFQPVAPLWHLPQLFLGFHRQLPPVCDALVRLAQPASTLYRPSSHPDTSSMQVNHATPFLQKRQLRCGEADFLKITELERVLAGWEYTTLACRAQAASTLPMCTGFNSIHTRVHSSRCLHWVLPFPQGSMWKRRQPPCLQIVLTEILLGEVSPTLD